MSGTHPLTVRVTAADGTTVTLYTVTVIVDLSPDTSLSTFTINGISVTDGATRHALFGTTSVTVVATPTNTGATAVVGGNTGLVSGTHPLTVRVTAADGTTVTLYTVTVIVDLDSDNPPKSIGIPQINPTSVIVFAVPYIPSTEDNQDIVTPLVSDTGDKITTSDDNDSNGDQDSKRSKKKGVKRPGF